MESFLFAMATVHALSIAWFAIGIYKLSEALDRLSKVEGALLAEGASIEEVAGKKMIRIRPAPREEAAAITDAEKSVRRLILWNLALTVACASWVTAWSVGANHGALAVSSAIVPASFVVGAIRAWLDIRG